MHALEPVPVDCPYCGEAIEISIDCSVARQAYVEDCPVCCHPIALRVVCEIDGVAVTARRDDDC